MSVGVARARTLVLHHHRHEWPLRLWEHEHVHAFADHADSRVSMLNLALPAPTSLVAALAPDLVVLHATALSMRYRPAGYETLRRAVEAVCRPSRGRTRPKVLAQPLDEFLDVDRLNDVMALAEVDRLDTCVAGDMRPTIYRGVRADRLRASLTSRVGPRLRRWAGRRRRRPERFDLVYGLWDAPAWLGRLGRLKVELASAARRAAGRLGLSVDIRGREAGGVRRWGAWMDFLRSGRATLGVEGGSSIVDFEGLVRGHLVETAAAQAAGAPPPPCPPALLALDGAFGEVRALSPRHLEAAVAGAAQILVRGAYGGVFEEGRHHLGVAEDLSDLEDAMDRLRDAPRIASLADEAARAVLGSAACDWRTYVRDAERELLS